MRSERKPSRNQMTLREMMDRLLEDTFAHPLRSVVEAGHRGSFPVDLLDAGDHFELRAALPGVHPDDLHVQIQGDVLTLRASTKPPAPAPGAPGGEPDRGRQPRWLVRELRGGSVERRIELPGDVAAEGAKAVLENGLLTLTLPRATQVAPRRIEVTRPVAHRNPSVVDPTKPEVEPGAMPADTPSMANPVDRPHKDAVTRESEESFPASDPPSWTPERA